MDVFIRRDGNREGPFTTDQLRIMLNEGKVSKTDFAFHDGLSNWLPLAAVLATRAQPPPFRGVTQPAANLQTQDSDVVSPTTLPAGAPSTIDASECDPAQGSRTPAPRTPLPEFWEKRGDLAASFASVAQGVKEVDWKSILPFLRLLQDKPWDLIWVRWLLILSIVPATIPWIASFGGAAADRLTLQLGLYVTLLWAIGLRLIIRPDVSGLSMAWVAFAPLLLQTPLILLAMHVNALNSFLSAVNGQYSTTRRFFSVLVVALISQSILAATLTLAARRPAVSARVLLFYGSVAGMLLAASSSCANFLNASWFDRDSITMLRPAGVGHLLPLMLVDGLMGGILGYITSQAWRQKKHLWALMIAGVAVLSSTRALFGIATATWGGPLIACALAVLYATYIRAAATCQSQTQQSDSSNPRS